MRCACLMCDHLIFCFCTFAILSAVSARQPVYCALDAALRCADQIGSVRAALRATHSEGFAAASSMRGCGIGSSLSARRRISCRTGRRSRARRCSPMRSPRRTAARTARAGTAARSPFTRRTGRIAHARIALCGALSRARGDGGWYPYVARYRHCCRRGAAHLALPAHARKHTGAEIARIGAQRVELLKPIPKTSVTNPNTPHILFSLHPHISK